MNTIILAGGKNKRFEGQCNKLFLELNGIKIIDIIISKVSVISDKILIVTKYPQQFSYISNKKVEIVKDIVTKNASLVGIYSGLVASDSLYNFVIGGDMPFVNVKLVEYMMRYIGDFDVIIPKLNNSCLPNKGYETLHAIYSKKCVRYIKDLLEKNNYKIIDFFGFVRVKDITEDRIKKIDPCLLSFFNINTKHDYHNAVKLCQNPHLSTG